MSQKISLQVQHLISHGEYGSLKEIIANSAPADICDILLLGTPQEQVLIFRSLSREQSGEVFSLLDSDQQDELLEILTNQETRQLLASLSPDDRAHLLSEMPSHVTRRLMGLMNSEDLHEVRQLLGYPEESVGRIMTPDYVRVRSNWTVRQVLDHIRFYGKDSETINVVYVVNELGVLLSSLRLRTLILAELDQVVEEILERNSEMALSVYADREEAVQLMKKYDVIALPVVDSKSELVGIVTIDDVMDVAEEEATEDMQKAASVSPLRMSYDKVGVLSLYQKRVGWLVFLVILNIVTASVVGVFDGQINPVTLAILFSFVPMMLGTGGNTGSQASTLIIRALTTGELTFKKFYATISKEIVLGIFLGLTLGFVASIISILRIGVDTRIPFVVALSMTSIVITANLVGIMLPFFLVKLKIDPAVASGPLISTLIDAFGLLIYFSIATNILV